ncbi:MAG: chloride channel protein [Ruminococcaceae bacterium]|nr:chloride channel protein [Oscillospiraceae bacterium]
MMYLKSVAEHIKILGKWIVIASVVGVLGGFVGSVFHLCVDYVTEIRGENLWLVFLLPLGAVVITALYDIFKSKGKLDTNRVIDSVVTEEKVPLVMAPLIFVSTIITHLLGGSAGREGAALQLGGSIGYNAGKIFRLDRHDLHLIVMSGMSAVFSALFGTPVAAAFFALEVSNVGVFHYAGLVPCLISSVSAFLVSKFYGIAPVRFENVSVGELTGTIFGKVIVLAVLCALISIIFCASIKQTEKISKKLLPNRYLRGLIGGALLVGLTVLVRSYDYNGAGMDIISKAMSGEAQYEAFILKMLFTVITIAAGFKGGEIVPTFFIGATFGCVIGPLLGLEAGFSAALGFVALFCGVVNCPAASVLLAVEIFGTDGILAYAIVCGISYMMSGRFSLYNSQKFAFSKLYEE